MPENSEPALRESYVPSSVCTSISEKMSGSAQLSPSKARAKCPSVMSSLKSRTSAPEKRDGSYVYE